MISERISVGSAFISIECSWAEFKSVMAAKDLALQHTRASGQVVAFAIDSAICYVSYISETAEADAASLTDFEDNYEALSNRPLASARADGVQRVQIEPASALKRAQIKGFKLVPTLPVSPATVAESWVDVGWDGVIAFQGIQGIEVQDHHTEDYLKLTAILPSGTSDAIWTGLALGAWPFGELAETPVDVELFVFGVDVHLPVSGRINAIVAESSFTFPQWIKLRFSYFAHGMVAPRMVGLVRVWV